MKKFLREYAANVVVSLVVAFTAFGASSNWGWPFIGSAAFAVAAGLLTAMVIRGIVVLWHRNRSVSDTDSSDEGRSDSTETMAEKASGAEAADGHGETGWREESSGKNPGGDDGTASGTGADESGPRGSVRRSEGYRSSLEDPN